MGASRAALIKGLWPDKALYAGTLLMLTGLLGLLYGLALWALLGSGALKFGPEVPAVVRAYPPEVTVLLSLATVAFAWLSLAKHRLLWGILGAATGIVGLGLMGLGSVLSVIALGCLLLAWREGEHANPETAELTADSWPDKALAASVVVLVAGVITAGWGWMLLTDQFEFQGYMGKAASGLLGLGVGALSILAAVLLYRQKAPWVAVAACVGGVLALGLYVVGPVLSLVALALVWKAWREDEFEPAPAPVARTVVPSARPTSPAPRAPAPPAGRAAAPPPKRP